LNFRVGIQGATGRTGTQIVELLQPGFTVGGDQLELESVAPIDVWIDFSRPQATIDLMKKINEPIVIGTTGFDEAQLATIRLYAETHPVLLSANMSPGMNAVFGALRNLNLKPQAVESVVLRDWHHKHKKDSPGGTAKTLMAILEEQGHQVRVEVTRSGEMPGAHEVQFISDDEEVVMSHRVWNRRVFAKGALCAAHWLVKQRRSGMYTMEDVLKGSQS